jgi:hypothetical protein
MKNISAIILSLSILFLPNVYADAPKVGKYPKVFKSKDYTVTMVKLGATDDKVFLVKVDGLDNDFDGQIFKHETKCNNTRCTSYKLETKEIPGKKRWWTIQSTNSWGSYDGLILYPPGIDKKSDLFQVERPEKFDSKAFYQAYLGQKTQR